MKKSFILYRQHDASFYETENAGCEAGKGEYICEEAVESVLGALPRKIRATVASHPIRGSVKVSRRKHNYRVGKKDHFPLTIDQMLLLKALKLKRDFWIKIQKVKR